LKDKRILYYIERADYFLERMGYTDHGIKHVGWVAQKARELLLAITGDRRLAELAGVAGLLHDIGHVVGRHDHAQSGALLAYQLLKGRGYLDDDLTEITFAIGNHEEGTGEPATEVAAALVIADKSHVHRTRVRSSKTIYEDIHDRVNYAVLYSNLLVDKKEKVVRLVLKIDTEISDLLDYFSIFQPRMEMCRRATQVLGYRFRIRINDTDL
ncbi:MAG: HD domain-containing protein, partial [Desulfurobacteriaceae bacterium]